MEFYADDLVPWLENQTSNLATGSASTSVTMAMDALVPSSNTHLQTLRSDANGSVGILWYHGGKEGRPISSINFIRNHLQFLGLFEFIRLGSTFDFIMNKHSFDSWMNTSSDSGTYNSTSSHLGFPVTTSTFWFFFLNINSMEIICDLYSQCLSCRSNKEKEVAEVVGSDKAKGRRAAVGRNREMGLRLLIFGGIRWENGCWQWCFLVVYRG
ncbi:unnamed protein product [Lactuca saligna]|uniref:Uncharacterized protein n=1 Tax=Lactuca saligna TaxID=75948 RepID=A0AA36EP34_LACSI|nr:unnamed protein product [Lactuca saligna]